jgi:hypothetical protein
MGNREGHLLGVVWPAPDGHRRITNGEGYTVVGGSQEAHEQMQERTAKIREEIDKRGEIRSAEEFQEIADKVQ